MVAARRIAIGRVVGAYGLHGGLRVRWLGDGPGNLLRAPEVALAAAPDQEEAPVHRVAKAEPGRPGEVRMSLAGIDDRNAAEAQKGRFVQVDTAHLEPLAEGELYWFQLVGCRVEDQEGHEVGTVRELWETGAHDLLVIESEDGRTRLVPATEALLKEVDLEERRIVVDAIPGLLEPQ